MKKVLLYLFLLLSLNCYSQRKKDCISGNCENGFGILLTKQKDTIYAMFSNKIAKPYFELHYKNGDIYKGYQFNNLPNGKGVMYYSSGDKYIGIWKNGHRQLTGSLIYADSTKIYADFESDKLVSPTLLKTGCIAGDCVYGLGSYIYANGTRYNGNFFGGLKNGKGSLEYPDGSIFTGEFILDTINGYGTTRYADGSYYEGMYLKGVRSGYGNFHNAKSTEDLQGLWIRGRFKKKLIVPEENTCLSGNDCENGKVKIKYGLYSDCPMCIYEGEMENGYRKGIGVLTYPDKSTISGFWEKDKYLRADTFSNSCNLGDCVTGYGRFDWISGEMYDGFWKNDKRSFFGKNKFKTGNLYIGFWKNDKKDGWGVQKFVNHEFYKGTFKNDWRYGYGEFDFSNGNKFYGEFKNDTIMGEGIMYYPSGKIERGIWQGDQLKKLKEDKFGCVSGDCWYGYGTYVSKNGARYSGSWLDSKYNGIGLMYGVDASIYYGQFKAGEKEGFGKQLWSNGERYIGFWKNGKIDGRGVYVFQNDSILRAFWREGKFLVKVPKNPDIPKIIWEKPLNNQSVVYSNKVDVLFGIISATKISNIQIYVNGKLVSNFAQYDTVPDNFPEFDKTISKTIELNEGKNNIYIKAINDYGEVVSTTKNIRYKKSEKRSKQALVVACDYNSKALQYYLENAKKMVNYLKNKEFEVKYLENPSRKELQNAIRSFGEDLLESQNEGCFYYGGLLKQVNSKNYFILDTQNISTTFDILRDALEVNPLLTEIQYGTCPMNEIILDYRILRISNLLFKLEGEWGVFPVRTPRNTSIFYSSMPGSELGKSVEPNLFFTAFYGRLTQGEDMLNAFKIAKSRVSRITKQHQIPYGVNNESSF